MEFEEIDQCWLPIPPPRQERRDRYDGPALRRNRHGIEERHLKWIATDEDIRKCEYCERGDVLEWRTKFGSSVQIWWYSTIHSLAGCAGFVAIRDGKILALTDDLRS